MINWRRITPPYTLRERDHPKSKTNIIPFWTDLIAEIHKCRFATPFGIQTSAAWPLLLGTALVSTRPFYGIYLFDMDIYGLSGRAVARGFYFRTYFENGPWKAPLRGTTEGNSYGDTMRIFWNLKGGRTISKHKSKEPTPNGDG